ncbi:FAD/NAD(P)-binding oxidoreductase, partial [Pseudomonas aeruginosa]
VQLGQALGYRLDGQALAVDEWQAGSLPDHYAAGECTGFGGSELALVEGAIAGHAAVDERDAARRLWPRRRRWQGFADTLARHFALRAELRELAEADTLVCRCEDVPLAALAGHAGWTEAKLHSRCGMGACQGRICGSAARLNGGRGAGGVQPNRNCAALPHIRPWQAPMPQRLCSLASV